MRSILILAILTILGGCATLHGRAETAFEHEQYLEAADLFDQIVTADPHDQDAIAHRDAARDGALTKLRTDYRTAPNPVAAAADLRELLDHRDAWSRAIDVTAEVAQTGMYLTGLIATRTSATGPLAGELLLHGYAPLLARADFRERRGVLQSIVADAAHAKCDALTTDTPYLTWVADRYCAHFAIARDDAQPLPDLRGGLTVEGTVIGATDAQRASLVAALSTAMRASVWYSATAPIVTAQLDGSIVQTVESHEVQLSKDWVETVSYTEDETTSEPYDESYQDTEFQTTSVPVTTYQSVPCGDTTCQEPTTTYESQTNLVTVTKTRTAYRDVTRTVTKYRDEPRTFTYAATQYTAHDVAKLGVRTELADAALADDFTEIGYDHDVTFAPAGIEPQRPNLTSQAALVTQEQNELRAKLLASLDARFLAEFCSATSFTAETAARCVYGDPAHAPVAARTAIAKVFGGDEPYLSAVLAAR